MKKILILFLVLITASCQRSSQLATTDSYHLLPLKSVLVFDIHSLEDLDEKLTENKFIASNLESKLAVRLKEKFDLLESIDSKMSGLLSVSSIGTKDFAFTFIVNSTSELFKAGAIDQKSSETYDGVAIETIQIEGQKFYVSELAKHQVISSSKLTLENTIRNSKNNLDLGATFLKLKKPVVIVISVFILILTILN